MNPAAVPGDAKPYQSLLDKLDDATTELMTGEGDSVMLMLGDGFMQCEEEYATEYCERKQEVRRVYVKRLPKKTPRTVTRLVDPPSHVGMGPLKAA